jgi:hypothetical protein
MPLLALPQGEAATTTILAWTGSSAPGDSSFGESASNTSFTTLGIPAVNDSSEVSFGASVNTIYSWPTPSHQGISKNSSKTHPPVVGTNPVAVIPKNTNSWSGIWRSDSNGSKSLVVKVGSPFMVVDAGGFNSLSDPVLNNGHVSAYAGTYQAGFIKPPDLLPGVPVTNFYSGSGVWTSASYLPAAFVGESPPGFPSPLITSVGTLSDLVNQESTNGISLSNAPITFTNLVNFSSIDRVVLPDTDRVIFSATVNTTNWYYPQVPTSPPYMMPMDVALQPLVQHGIWAQSASGNLTLIAREGETLHVEGNDKMIETLSFLACRNEAGGQTRSFNQTTGDVVYRATFTDASEALFLSSSSLSTNQSTLISASGDPAPGLTSNILFTSFGDPVLNASNHVAFSATASCVTTISFGSAPVITPGSSNFSNLSDSLGFETQSNTNSWTGIWADDSNGNLQLVAKSIMTSSFIQLVGGNGFTSFSDPVYNASNSVAFIGTWYSDGTPIRNRFNGGKGVWTSRNLTNPIAWIGQNAPGYPQPLVITVGSPYSWSTNKISFNSAPPIFSSFDRIALPDTGHLLLWATVSVTNDIPQPTIPASKRARITPNKAISQSVLSQRGIWRQNDSGGLDLIVREGGSLLINGTKRIISSLSSATAEGPTGSQSRSFNQSTGTVSFRATFTDDTQAIVLVTFP